MCGWLSAKQKERREMNEECIGEHRGQPGTEIKTVSQLFILPTCNSQNYMIRVNLMCQCISQILLFLYTDISVQIDNIFNTFEQRRVT